MSFWGLVVEPEKLYSQTISHPYKVTMAVLETDGSASDKNNSKSSATFVSLAVNKKEFKICKLIPERHEQQTMNLILQAGAEIDFKVVGEKPATVYLTGYYLDEFAERDEMEDLTEDFTDDDGEIVSVMSESSMEAESESVESISGAEEDDGHDTCGKNSSNHANKENSKKIKTTDCPVKKPAQPTPENSRIDSPVKKISNEEIKKDSTPGRQLVKKRLPNGLEMEDISLGEGVRAKKGHRVGITFSGRLEDGTLFDEVKGNDIRYFTIGKREVLPGLDLGVEGISLGGVRRLKVPPPLGYGEKQQRRVPPNSTLIFEVKLVKVDTKKNVD